MNGAVYFMYFACTIGLDEAPANIFFHWQSNEFFLFMNKFIV